MGLVTVISYILGLCIIIHNKCFSFSPSDQKLNATYIVMQLLPDTPGLYSGIMSQTLKLYSVLLWSVIYVHVHYH